VTGAVIIKATVIMAIFFMTPSGVGPPLQRRFPCFVSCPHSAKKAWNRLRQAGRK
jgi:hypothetical protein